MTRIGTIMAIRRWTGRIFRMSVLAVIIGWLLNFCVMHLNGGMMPVLLTDSHIDQAFYRNQIAKDGSFEKTAHTLATPQTKLLWAADRIRHTEIVYDDRGNPNEEVKGMSSVGDALMLSGFALIFICGIVVLGFLFDDPYFFRR